ncbi:hypothetical protein RRG08_050836 [Elysia crispata]|uniref:Uncharacterized protein n=1 Tax=Elysia crispata TaxID=231223 RepID=A0AAE1AFN4_9GAST|nr:hypothetical protein RRG08_050836 [Elysia crispata]
MQGVSTVHPRPQSPRPLATSQPSLERQSFIDLLIATHEALWLFHGSYHRLIGQCVGFDNFRSLATRNPQLSPAKTAPKAPVICLVSPTSKCTIFFLQVSRVDHPNRVSVGADYLVSTGPP